MSARCPYNIVNFGPLAAEIVSLVWGTPCNFNGFRVLATLLHGTLLVVLSLTQFNDLLMTSPESRARSR